MSRRIEIRGEIWGIEHRRLSSEAIKLIKGRQLKTRSLEELLRFANILKLRSK